MPNWSYKFQMQAGVGPILVITGPTFTKLVDDASCDTDDLTSLDAICLTFTCWRGLMFRDQV